MQIPRLLSYAEWYYTKYFPSRKVLCEKLTWKGASKEEIAQILTSMEGIIVEEKVIESRVHEYVHQGKTAQYIRQKLLQKKFEKDLIEQYLQAESETLKNPETYRAQIEKMIQQGMNRLSSKKILQYTIIQKYPESKDIIHELLTEYPDIEIIEKKAPELLRKYSQEQVMTKLIQKGFSTRDIYAFLRRK